MNKPLDSKLALEMTMQDVMGNLAELSYAAAYSDGEACFEILSIEPAEVPDQYTPGKNPAWRDIFSQRGEIVRLRVA